MEIKTKSSYYGFEIIIENDSTTIKECVSSFITKSVDQKTIDQLFGAGMEASRYGNTVSDVETIKKLIESTLSDDEQKELIKSLEN
jgi:hypothetical protein